MVCLEASPQAGPHKAARTRLEIKAVLSPETSSPVRLGLIGIQKRRGQVNFFLCSLRVHPERGRARSRRDPHGRAPGLREIDPPAPGELGEDRRPRSSTKTTLSRRSSGRALTDRHFYSSALPESREFSRRRRVFCDRVRAFRGVTGRRRRCEGRHEPFRGFVTHGKCRLEAGLNGR